MSLCLNKGIKLGPHEGKVLSDYHVTIYSEVPVLHILVFPHNGADSLGLQLQELSLFCVTAASGQPCASVKTQTLSENGTVVPIFQQLPI